ncbi:MAG TPA: restriction endonuclease subunit R [Candidatus Atribacteria bacterium]|nr:restriction endonuclease subunit R [Candidatus Atribacteria bacterium]
MARIFLQNIIEESKRFGDLPANWNSFGLEKFSKTKKLWDYQQKAVKNAITILWKYFEDFSDYQEGERLEVNQERKRRFFKWYKDNGLEEKLDIKLDKRKRNIYNLLTEYYQQEDSKIPYENFTNRMCFWMATGSGKTLVIIKLIQILKELIERKEIPSYDILFLTHRDDLIEQLKKHVGEFNYANETKIDLRELKEYPEVKRQRNLFGITVFYYRSDNLNDEQKDKIVDFKNYDNDGKWYVFLDEAHKGDREDSKRQQIYSILSRNGFLFNSSATFIDSRDIVTCAYDFNLKKYINAGYGKHIGILKQEIRAFREKEDYSDEEKQKIVLKSLILLTYVKKFYGEITKINESLYHKPLLLTLVNSVSTENADLKLFFRELEKIGKGEIEEEVFKNALNELWAELKEEPEFIFEPDRKIKIDEKIIKDITKNDILYHIYNSKTSGEIEILRRLSNKKELAFKLKTSDKPFALIKIGDISGWLKDELVGYEIQERFKDESYFENLNKEDSEINILMGSRSFYEGWDSNRPNVINFINIGVGQEARKFVLQSVGRGVRIEPFKDKRKRLLELYNAQEIEENLFNQVKDRVLPMESLFIFGTNREALKTVLEKLELEGKGEGESQLSLFINKEVKEHKLLVPTYKEANYSLMKKRELTSFEINEQELKILKQYIEFIQDDRVFLMRYNSDPEKIKILKESINNPDRFKDSNKNFKNIDILIQRIFNYFSIKPQELKNLKEIDEEIKHYKNIKVYLEDINEIQNKIEKAKSYPNKKKKLEKELSKLSDEVRRNIEGLLIKEATETYSFDHKGITIKYVAHHYYIPLILSETNSTEEKISYIRHIIKTPSEVRFVEDLEDYLITGDNKFKEFDWWMFSKLDESLDEVYIPYYNPNENKISNFNPDFIFWLQKGNKYFIVFVDPKGTEHSGWADKLNGYKNIFEEKFKEINYNGFKVGVKLFFISRDASIVSQRFPEHSRYWFSDIGKMLKAII